MMNRHFMDQTNRKIFLIDESNDLNGFDDPWKVMSDEDRKEANKLFKASMKAYPSSPKQKAISEKLQALLKKYGIGKT